MIRLVTVTFSPTNKASSWKFAKFVKSTWALNPVLHLNQLDRIHQMKVEINTKYFDSSHNQPHFLLLLQLTASIREQSRSDTTFLSNLWSKFLWIDMVTKGDSAVPMIFDPPLRTKQSKIWNKKNLKNLISKS